jgi:predicted RNA methylase
VAWTTSGNGTFSSTTILNPVYTPGATDITAGTVTLTLTASAISPCTVSATDTKILIIQKTPTANAGVDATVCQGSTHTLAGTAQNQNTVLWTTSGTGTFSSTTILNPVYTPGATDITAGTVTLTLTTSAISPCTVSATDTKILVIQKTPTANAGTDATICQGSTHTLAGTASNQGTVAWTTSGNGSFSSTTILTPIYTPGATDISAGTVTLTLTTSAISPCTVSATDTKILVIQKTPTANAGTDATICQGSTHTLAGTATNQASVLWTTSGNGTFSATNSLTPVYTPGTTDVTAGTVTLTLTAAAVTPCTVSSSDQKILTIQKSPTANAGIDATVCQGSTHTLAGTAQNQSSVLWTTSGTGTFSSTSSLASIYTPGVADITAGTVTLTLTASALSPCTVSATDTKILTIQKTPTAYAGVDATICQGSSHALAGTAQNQNTVLWTTSGTGTFSSTSSLASIYTPGVADITAGTVTLTLTASAISPCTVSGTDTKILTIQKTPTANAGIDATINQGSIHQLLGSAQYQTNVLWTTSGDGTFSSTSSLTPVYNPGATDIAAGNVQLCINATPVSPCVLADTDCLILTILQQENLLLRIPTDVTIGQNETGLIPIILENPNSVEIEAFDLVIHYNSAYINISNVLLTGGVLENQNYISQINTSFPGQVIIILYAGGNLFSGEGVICYLSASAPGAVGACSDLDLTMAQINEEDVLVTNGQVCIIQTLFDITGNVGYFGNSNPVSDVLLTLTGDGNYSATTNPDGLYQYSSVLRGDYISTPSKNNDLGGLSGTDASRIARYPAGLFTLNCMEQIAADVSLNGSISGVDASRVARYSAGLITELNPEIKNWVFTPENIASCPNWPPIGWIDNRTYTDINADLTGQDFTAVRLGDVTGNWAPDSKFKDETFTQGERKAEYNPSADSIQLLVYLNEPLSIEGVDITLEYDASKLKFVNAGFESSIFEGSDYEMQVKESTGGKLKMVIYALGDLYFGDGVLTKITFAVTSETTKPARVALTSLSVNEYRVKGWLALQNEPFGHQFKTEALSIVPDVESSLMAVYPNPFQNKTCISYYLKEQSQVTVQITDINGKLVTTLANEVQNEGIKELWWNGDNDQKQQLPQGVYFAVFKSENSFEVKRIVLIR